MNKKKLQPFFKFLAAILIVATFFLIIRSFFFDTASKVENPTKTFNKEIGGTEDLPEASSVDIDGVLNEFMLKDKKDLPRVVFFDEFGDEYDFLDYRDNFLIVYFWASWCAPCNEELKTLQTLNSDFDYNQMQDIEILPISIDYKEIYDVNNFYRSIGIDTLHLFLDPNKEMMNAFEVTSLPSTFLVDKSGKIIAKIDKHLDWSHNVIYKELIKLKGEDTTFKSNKLRQKKDQEIDDKSNQQGIMQKEIKKKVIIIK